MILQKRKKSFSIKEKNLGEHSNAYYLFIKRVCKKLDENFIQEL